MPLPRFVRAAALAPVVAAGLLLAPAAAQSASAAPSTPRSDSWARERLAQAGIGVWSSGGCADRQNPNCTSLEGIREATVEWTIILKSESGCPLLVTGGTEVGHAGGSYSHAAGYRVDLNADSCLAAHIHRHFTPVGGGIWYSPSGNRYYDEGSHWDVTFF